MEGRQHRLKQLGTAASAMLGAKVVAILAPFIAGFLAIFALVLVVALIVPSSPLGARGSSAQGTFECGLSTKSEIPESLVPLYSAAAAAYELGAEGPSILAGINSVETDFGRNLNVSSAGAVGWMQFMPATWATYGVDANGDGEADPWNREDAIFAAAHYLGATGGKRGEWRTALFAYNHSFSYVQEVLKRASGFRGVGCVATSSSAPRERIAEIARSQLGVSEQPPGSNVNPYGWTAAWCVMFAKWTWKKAGISTVPASDAVADLEAFGRANGTWKPGPDDPQVGDMVVFLSSAGNHTALVERVFADGRIAVIGGNQGANGDVSRVGPARPASGSLGPGAIAGYVSPPGA